MTVAHGFTYEIIHGDDFDPACDVCTLHTEILHKILGEWLEDAVFVDRGMPTLIEHQKRNVILKPMPWLPMVKRIGLWFVELFDDTIKLAAVDKILFREVDTGNVYEFIITY